VSRAGGRQILLFGAFAQRDFRASAIRAARRFRSAAL